MPHETILRVAVAAPLRQPLDYLPPAGGAVAQAGMRAIVPLGARKVMGIVTAVTNASDLAPGRLRRVIDLPDAAPLLPPEVLELCDFASRYYHAPPGEVLVGILPLEFRVVERARARPTRRWSAVPEAAALPPGALSRAPRQAAALEYLLGAPAGATDAECRLAQIDPSTLRTLKGKGLVRHADDTSPAVALRSLCDPVPSPVHIATRPELNPHQQAALDALLARGEGYSCTLLEGVTGSGKTEVYLRFLEWILSLGRQALVLVPEIGLTPQTRRRFEARFGNRVGVLHSGLSDGERSCTWREAAAGRVGVLVGTRSALFCPLPALGAIIVDEEHDPSFKQQEGFRYSARDLAVVRASQRGIPVLLGSATPSTETLLNCTNGRFARLVLPERAGGALAPTMQLVDIRGKALEGGLSQELCDAVAEQLGAGNQVLVFLNRRGWAPVLNCADCGWMAECTRCDARLTLHRADRRLCCHHCDAQLPAPRSCPRCNSARLTALGAGTERSEHALQRLFPQVPIHRIDRGTMQGRDAMDGLVQELERGEPCILVGTQMLAKGHHFPAVTLVAIVDLDGGLFSADLRAAERTGQLLIQVAGRAGRAERPGTVLLQTLHPGHPWLERLLNGGYREFIEPLLADRQLHGLPPFAHIALLRVESPRQESAERHLAMLKRELLASHPRVDIVGPLPAPLARRAGRFRLQLLLKHPHRAPLHAALEQACAILDSGRFAAAERWHVDVDPVEGV